jgi:hypothetical protein
MKDYLIVVDANFQSSARAAMADAKKVSDEVVEYVVDTHHRGSCGDRYAENRGARRIRHSGSNTCAGMARATIASSTNAARQCRPSSVCTPPEKHVKAIIE